MRDPRKNLVKLSRQRRRAMLAAIIIASSPVMADGPLHDSTGVFPPLPLSSVADGEKVHSNPFCEPTTDSDAAPDVQLASGSDSSSIRLKPIGAAIGLQSISVEPTELDRSSMTIEPVGPAAVRTNPLVKSTHHTNHELVDTKVVDHAPPAPMNSRFKRWPGPAPKMGQSSIVLLPSADVEAPVFEQHATPAPAAPISPQPDPIINPPVGVPSIASRPIIWQPIAEQQPITSQPMIRPLVAAQQPVAAQPAAAEQPVAAPPVAVQQPIAAPLAQPVAAPQPISPLTVAAQQPVAPPAVSVQPITAQPVAAQPVIPQPVAAPQPNAASPVAAQPVASPPVAAQQPVAAPYAQPIAAPPVIPQPVAAPQPIAVTPAAVQPLAVPPIAVPPVAAVAAPAVAAQPVAPAPTASVAEEPETEEPDPVIFSMSDRLSSNADAVANESGSVELGLVEPFVLDDSEVQGSLKPIESVIENNGDLPIAIYRSERTKRVPTETPEAALHAKRYRPPVAVKPVPIAVERSTEEPKLLAASTVQPVQALNLNGMGGNASKAKLTPLYMSRAQVRSLTLGGEVRGVKVADKTVCEAFASGSNQLKLIGTGKGVTRLVVWADADDVDAPTRMRTFEVHVRDNIETAGDEIGDKAALLNQSIRKAFPESRVNVQRHRGELIVTGRCDSETTAKKIIRMVRKTCLVPVQDELVVR